MDQINILLKNLCIASNIFVAVEKHLKFMKFHYIVPPATTFEN